LSMSYHVYVVSDVKDPLSLKWRSGFLSYLIIIIIVHPDIAINELMGRKAIFNQPTRHLTSRCRKFNEENEYNYFK